MQFGSYLLVNTGVAQVGDGFAGDALDSTLLTVCDPRIGDYVARWADTIAGGRPDGGTGTSSVIAYETAGVAMHLRVGGVASGTGFETQLRSPDGHYFTVPGDLAAPDRTPSPYSVVGTSIVPGAVAWISPASRTDAGRTSTTPRAVWLADRDGARIIGRISADTTDARLGLTDQTVSWADTTGQHSVPIAPIPQDAVAVVSSYR